MGICSRLFKIKNIPNSITLLRIFMSVWIFKIGFYQEDNPLTLLFWATAAGVSDVLDGWLAKIKHWETEFGAAFDPAADKIFIAAILFAFYMLDYCPKDNVLTPIRILKYFAGFLATVEFILIVFYLVGLCRKIPLLASKWGKWKMRFFCGAVYVWIIYFIFVQSDDAQIPILVVLLADMLLIVTIICAGFSLDDYWARYKNYLQKTKNCERRE